MNWMHPAAILIDDLLADCLVERTRRGGPGGQHRNKVETAVVITHRPTGIRGEASERRSQAENHLQAVYRLRIALALAVRTPAAAEASPRWRSRINAGRIAINAEHDDAPALLAEALDVLAANGWGLAEAGEVLKASPTQLVKFLKQHGALPLLNSQRRSQGLAPLR